MLHRAVLLSGSGLLFPSFYCIWVNTGHLKICQEMRKKRKRMQIPLRFVCGGKENWVVKGCGSITAATLLQQREDHARAN